MWWMLAFSFFIVCDRMAAAQVPATCADVRIVSVACRPEMDSGMVQLPQPHLTRVSVPSRLVSGAPEDTEKPRVWLGVIVTDVPPSLAAHVGGEGLMVTNVAKGSPADRAGIEQYDIVRSFNGKAVTDLDALLSEIKASGAGSQVKIEVIRGGKSQTLTVTPEQRTDELGDIEYKYEMPEDVVDQSSMIRGHTLRRLGDGTWKLDDLGALDNFPDSLRQLLEERIGRGGHSFSWSWPKDKDALFNFNWNLDSAVDGDVRFQVEVNRDGEMLSVRRDADGTIRVDRTDRDGKTSSTTYDNADALREQDPEAFELYDRMSRRQPMIMIDPNPAQLEKLRSKYQEQIKRHLDSARQRTEEELRRAEDARAKAMEEAQRALRDAERRRTPRARAAPGSANEATPAPEVRRPAAAGGMNVTIDKDGSIAVVITRDGQTLEYRFANDADFKQREPKLYEQYLKLRE